MTFSQAVDRTGRDSRLLLPQPICKRAAFAGAAAAAATDAAGRYMADVSDRLPR